MIYSAVTIYERITFFQYHFRIAPYVIMITSHVGIINFKTQKTFLFHKIHPGAPFTNMDKL